MKRAKFPQLKTLAEFDYSFQNSITQQSMRDLEGLDFMHAKENIVFLGPSGVGKTHLAIGLGVAAVTLTLPSGGTLFANTSTAAATLDRLMHHAHVFNMKGDSYRMRSRLIQPNIEQVSELPELVDQQN